MLKGSREDTKLKKKKKYENKECFKPLWGQQNVHELQNYIN